ncbi:Cyclin-C [Acipenser ruthenus]|uniref:Cyclin-C n=1 Tax=Acipenser ruthenus TaxID=7906 RepID=A0A444TY41_ACIRT|nr:Cyclin-C [Acipenser ruthenus]
MPLDVFSLQWILDKQDLMKERQKDLKFLAEEEYWKLQIFFANVIQALGEHLKLRQQVIATATVYFKRFYASIYSSKRALIQQQIFCVCCFFQEFGVVSNTRLISAATSVSCLHVACVVQQKDARQWFAELSVDMEKILEIIRVILKLYDQWKNFDDRKEMAAILNKMPKPKPPPNSVCPQFPVCENRINVSANISKGRNTCASGFFVTSIDTSSCLYQFSLLMGNNKLLCEDCTDTSETPEKDQYNCIMFCMLVSLYNIVESERVLYSLYGIVEHSGSMRGGHYTACGEIRSCHKRQEHRRNVADQKETVGESPGQRDYVSDTHVQTVPESRVLNSQAYLLFYEASL